MDTNEVAAVKEEKQRMSIGRMIRAVLVFVIGFTLWWNKFAIYRFIGDILTPSPVVWQSYSIHFGEDNWVISKYDKSLTIFNKEDFSALLDIYKYGSH